jgi:hypothetical protein
MKSFDTEIFKENKMRVMVFVKASEQSEAGIMPSKELLAEMGKFNEELIKAGVMQAAEGLQASSKGARVKFEGGKRSVIDGPFPETKELIAGFWIWKVKSLQDAIDWLKRAPFGGGTEVEIRPIFEHEEFAKNLTPEHRERYERFRREEAKQVAGKK